jgi:acyl-[acyl-carrier-protein]-phospholipid O-acyltransferase/long-chain-fatty-acid--[acyl-carrier-protein] ligase
LSPIVSINFSNSIFDLSSRSGKPGSIGCPIPGVHVRITDPETGVELGPGESGRMLVKGGIVMSGYLNMPEQTARVIQNGYYDTGDIAKLDKDGYIFITGRASRFSKIGGEMVPHETLEDAIGRFCKSEMKEVAVTGRSDAKRGEKLIVFYTPENMVIADVINYLKEEKYPNLWIPKEEDFVKVDALPLLGSGKLDVRKLNQMAAEYNKK